MKGSFSRLVSRGRVALALVVIGAAFAACSLDPEGTAQPGTPTGTGGEGGTGGIANTGGAGGVAVGGAGGEAGAGGSGGQPTLATWDADEPDLTTGTYTLPDWLSFESPSDGKTSQIGPDMLRTGFGPDEPRARSLDGATWGLSVEGERTNRVYSSRISTATGWTVVGGGTLIVTTGPDGTDGATNVNDTDTFNQTAVNGSFYAEPAAVSTLSAWVTTGPVVASLECNAFPLSPQSAWKLPIPAATGWRRVSLTGAETSAAAIARVRPAADINASTGDAAFDLITHETGRYPSSVIITHPVDNPAPATRMAERLYAPAAADLAPDGYFHAVLVFAPHYADGEQAGPHDLLHFDDQHRVYVRADSAVVLQEAGVDVLATQPLAWERDQVLTIEVMNLPGNRLLRVTGALAGEASIEDDGDAPFPTGGPLHLLGGPAGSQEGADLRSITFHALPM